MELEFKFRLILKIKKHENQNVICVDDNVFDWDVGEQELIEAIKFAENDVNLKDQILKSLRKHFLDSLSEVIGRNITIKELNLALQNGFIK